MFKTKYYKQICKENERLGRMKNTIFLGQQVGMFDFYGTLKNVSPKKRIEMPVAEDMQTGMAIGLALEGYLPVSIYQRMDFLPRACDQLVNHLSIMKDLSEGKVNPKVILRTTVGSSKPLDTGLQHKKDLTKGFVELLDFPVLNVTTVDEVKDAYKMARERNSPILIIEYQDLYKEKK